MVTSSDPYAAYANPVREEKTPKQRATEANIEQSETGTARTAALTPYEVREKQLAIEKKATVDEIFNNFGFINF